jgi:hypothetical protein
MAMKRGRKMKHIAEKLEEPNAAQLARGDFRRDYVTHVETNTKAMAYRNRSNIVEKWFTEGWPGFEEPARLAINWCHDAWEARGIIGKFSANYEPTIGSGGNSQYARSVELRDDLDRIKQLFHPTHWQVYENVVRWGLPAGVAGSDMAANTGQSIAAARATVGLVANFIAAKRGY